MSISELDAAVSNAVGAAWTSNTLATRNSQWKKYLCFCSESDQIPLPADVQTVVRFLVYLARTCKYSTVNNYLSAVISLHNFYGYSAAFRDSFLVKLVMKGLKSQLGDHVTQMKPLTIQQLSDIHSQCVLTEYDVIIWSVIILSFRSLLRKSNLVPDSPTKMGHVIRRRDAEFHDWGVMVKVRSSKTLQYQEYVLDIPIYYVNNHVFCVASAIKQHLENTPEGSLDGPIFLKKLDGRRCPVLYKDVLAFLKQGVIKIGLQPHEYGVHSLRRAGAGFLHGLGVPLQDLMSIGDWKSLAVLDYLITPVHREKDIQSTVANALQ